MGIPEIDLAKVDSPTLRRLIEEVRNEATQPCGYNRFHNRHNRSIHPTPKPPPEPPSEPPTTG